MDNGLSNEPQTTTYDNAPCGFLSTDIDGTILQINQTLLDWTGNQRADLNGKRLQDLLTVPGKIFYETQYYPLLQIQGFVKEVSVDLVRKQKAPLSVLINSRQTAPKD
jgi:PAS domain S-box-containing protein